MSESDTPRTDAVISGLQASAPWWDKSLVENARQLERELTAANARADDLQTRLAVLTAGVEAQRVVIEAANDRAETLRQQLNEAQKWLKLSMDDGPITGQGWIDARKACEAGEGE